MNGVEGSASHDSWEVLHIESRRVSIQSIRDKIDSIEPASVQAIPPTLSNSRLIDGEFVFEVDGTAGRNAIVQISMDGLQWDDVQEVTLGDSPVTVRQPIDDDSPLSLFRVIVP